jgi:hypothetical protein
MFKFGVAIPNIKAKMVGEGIDPSLLEVKIFLIFWFYIILSFLLIHSSKNRNTLISTLKLSGKLEPQTDANRVMKNAFSSDDFQVCA